VLVYIFTIAFTNKYKERNIELREELVSKEETWKKETFKQMSELYQTITDLEKENEQLRRLNNE
jgi:hypothetical protein